MTAACAVRLPEDPGAIAIEVPVTVRLAVL